MGNLAGKLGRRDQAAFKSLFLHEEKAKAEKSDKRGGESDANSKHDEDKQQSRQPQGDLERVVVRKQRLDVKQFNHRHP